MNLNLFNILTSLLIEIPNELTLRDTSIAQVVGLGLFVSFGLLALTKLMNKEVFRTLIIVNSKGHSIKQYLKEEHPLNTGWSFILIVNYCLSFFLIGYVIAEFPGFENIPRLLLVVFIPIIWVLFTQLSIYSVSLLTGEYGTLKQFIYYRVVGIQLLGVVLFIIGSIWILTAMSSKTLMLISIILISLEFLIRIIKSVIFARQKRISWYYIILYICTLETLPLLVCYYLINGVFKFN